MNLIYGEGSLSAFLNPLVGTRFLAPIADYWARMKLRPAYQTAIAK